MAPPPTLEGDSAAPPDEPAGVWHELWRRRVPYFVGAYVAAIAGIVQFVDWMVDRYALSPALTDFTLVGLLLLVPTAFMLAWRHGQPGRNRWTRTERLGVPLNLVVAAAVLFAAFNGRSLGATTTTVIVEDEEGNAVEAVVAKSEFRRHIALFNFDNETGDAELDWLQYGIPRGIWADWRQDPFMDVRESLAMQQDLREAGRPDGLDLPLALASQIAGEQNVDYFLTGELGVDESGLFATTTLYEVGGNRVVAERTHTGTAYELIDAISRQVREDLGIPGQRLSETTDLPLDELLTDSETAYRAYVDAFRALSVESDYGRALSLLGEAVAEDSSFALAHWLRYAVAGVSNQSAVGIEALQASMRHRYRLPEREQYYVRREFHYVVGQDPEKGIKLAEMSVELFPDDIEGRGVLGLYYRLADRTEEAIEQFLEILRLAPTQYQVLKAIGSAYMSLGRYDEAVDYLGRYTELAPQDMETYPLLGEAHRARGRFDEAREECERPLLLEPEDVGARLCLAAVALAVADWGEAERQYDEAAAMARTAADRAALYQERAGYHVLRGRIGAAIADRNAELPELAASGAPPIQVLARRLQTLTRFVLAGRTQAALDSAAALAAQFQPPFDQMSAIGELAIFDLIGDVEGLEAAIEKGEGVIRTLGFEALRPRLLFAEGRVLELRGDCDAALAEYRRAIEADPTSTSWRRSAARCLRTLGRADEAALELEPLLLRSPNAPRTLVELARIELERGNDAGAIERLEQALVVWSDADPGYAPADEARTLLASLRSG